MLSSQYNIYQLPNSGLPFEFRCGARTNSRLLYSLSERELYRRRNGKNMSYERYVCNVASCKAVLILKDGVLRRANKFKQHQHEDQEDKYERDKFDNLVKQDIRTSVTGINEIFNNNLMKDEKGGATISFNKKRRNYARIRSGTTPAGPKTGGNRAVLRKRCDYEQIWIHER